MTEHFDNHDSNLDDAQIAALVRSVAADWSIPSQRLDQPTWRDRVRGRRSIVRAAPSVWLARLGRAAGLALVVTVAVAITGVLLTSRPALGPAGSGVASGSSGPTDGASPGGPFSSSLRPGSRPAAAILAEFEEGDYRVVGILGNEVGPRIAGGGWGSVARRFDDGSYYCLCVLYSDIQANRATHASVTYSHFNALDENRTTIEVVHFDGKPDPRDGGGVPDEPDHVRVAVTFGSDRRYAYVGWSARDYPVWRSGITVVDVTDGSIVDSLDLPDAPAGEGDTRRVTDAPRVIGGSGSELVVGRAFYEFSPADAAEPSFHQGTDVFDVKSDAGTLDSAEAIDAFTDCGDYAQNGGRAGGGLWVACVRGSSLGIIRLDAQGDVIDDTSVSMVGGIDGSTTAVSADGSTLYAWNPLGLRLTRVDLATGATDSVAAEQKPASSDLFREIGNWLVPSTQAKMVLKSGVALSPDGTKLYALGMAGVGESSGSAGVFAFSLGEAMTYEAWPATADFISVAVSADGRLVYAVGMPDVDANGAPAEQQASVTVFDAATGDVVTFADKLGGMMFTLPEQIVR